MSAGLGHDSWPSVGQPHWSSVIRTAHAGPASHWPTRKLDVAPKVCGDQRWLTDGNLRFSPSLLVLFTPFAFLNYPLRTSIKGVRGLKLQTPFACLIPTFLPFNVKREDAMGIVSFAIHDEIMGASHRIGVSLLFILLPVGDPCNRVRREGERVQSHLHAR
uniref:Uncharacterized protein n=1 Tax=Strigamia maritima TaxID=126957 RepID=T1JHE5_STRMM